MNNELHLYQFGPWKENTISYDVRNRYQQQEQQKIEIKPSNIQRLPRMERRTIRQKYQLEHLPINIHQLELHQSDKKNYLQKKNSGSINKTIEHQIQSPNISFYNRLIPKTHRKDKFQIKIKDLWNPERQSRILSKIKASHQLQKFATVENSPQKFQRKSVEKQFARKRSLLELLKYMKSQSYQSPMFTERPKQKNIFQDSRLIKYDMNLQNRYYYPNPAISNVKTLKYQKSKSKI